jgi:hypothetical protein
MKKTQLTLSNVLSKFQEGLEKEAEEAAETPVSTEEDTAVQTPPEKDKAGEQEDKKVPVEKAAADTKTETDADVLKGIAKEAAESEETNLKKEAGEFGRLFAQSFMEELEVENMVKQASEDAYAATVGVIQEMDFQEKLASVYDEARQMTSEAVIEKSAYDTTCAAIEKLAAEAVTVQLSSITKEAYDLTVETVKAAETDA